jgi:trimeric autotransporter adhesin
VPVFVFPEFSTTKISFFSLNAQQTQVVPFSGGGYGSLVFLRADVAGRSGFGDATGNVILTDDGKSIQGNPFKLNSEGNTLTPNSSTTFAVGVHTIRATYDGDLSFLPSEAQPLSFTITKGVTTTTVAASATTAVQGASVTLTATGNTSSFGNPPTGSVKFTLGGTSLGPAVPVTGNTDPNTGLVSATASISTTTLPLGADSVTATYTGDKNYVGSNGSGSVTITAPAPAAAN